MRQVGNEKNDPLKRIQEEINEVARREQELREKMLLQQQKQEHALIQDKQENDLLNPNSASSSSSSVSSTSSSSSSLSLKTTTAPTTITAPSALETAKMSSKNFINETQYEDSGFSKSLSPINGTSATNSHYSTTTITGSTTKGVSNNTERKYIRSNRYNSIPNPLPQKNLTRAMSTPQISCVPPVSRFSLINPSQKGLMQKFIASRGKLPIHNGPNSTNYAGGAVNGRSLGNRDSNHINNFGDNNNSNRMGFFPSISINPPTIERDENGKPIRRGYIPVEEKIQKELKDLRSRETELKRLRKLRQSHSDLLDSIEIEHVNESEDDDDSDVEHCFPPGLLKSSKSISELCDKTNGNNFSTRTTPSPDFNMKIQNSRQNNRLRPAVSLATLCDLDPDEAPSSHQLIAKWENLIQQNA